MTEEPSALGRRVSRYNFNVAIFSLCSLFAVFLQHDAAIFSNIQPFFGDEKQKENQPKPKELTGSQIGRGDWTRTSDLTPPRRGATPCKELNASYLCQADFSVQFICSF